MKTDKSCMGCWQSWYAVGTCLVALLFLSGCGGEIGTATSSISSGSSGGGVIIGGVGTGGTGVVKSVLKEPVTGNILISAVVFVDKNGNRLPDPGEPSVVTDQEGSYTLPADAAELAAYPLLMQAIAGTTIVKATGQVVTSSYVTSISP